MIKFIKILFSFFNKTDRKFFIVLVMMMVLTASIELLGIGSLFPYIKILGDQTIIHSNNIMNSIYHFFGFSSNNHFLIFIGAMIFLMILLKGLMTCCNNYYQAKFTYRLNNRLANFCLESFIRMPYDEVINSNSAVLSKHLLVDVASVATTLTAVLTMLTDIIIALALISLMILANPLLVFSVVFILGGLLWLIIKLTKNKVKNLAKDNEYCTRHVYKTASESLAGIKDIKVYQVENYFVRRYLRWRHELSNQLVQFNFISNLPAIIMNVMGFAILLIILLYLVITRGNLLVILPTIGLIAVCIQRLLPASNRISTSIGAIRRYKPMIFIVRKAIDNLLNINSLYRAEKFTPNIKFNSVLSLKNIYYKYPSSEKYALSDISLDIYKNTSIGIVGESGAGKSTFVDVLLGLLAVEQGQIWCDNINITQYGYAALTKLVGYVPQQTFLIDGTIRENIAFGVEENKINNDALNKAIGVSQLQTLISELPEGLDTIIGEKGIRLSGGQRQRIGIARALYPDPEILVMDEATNALDAATEREFTESLLNLMKEKTLIIIAHRLSSVKHCQRLIQFEDGKVVAQGSFEKLVTTSEKFRQIYDVVHETW